MERHIKLEMGTLLPKNVARFQSFVLVAGSDDCWLWQGNNARKRYGRFKLASQYLEAHRVAYMIAHGLDFLGTSQVVRHTCDNGKCVNPRHLLLGTQLDNVRDMDAKGRRKVGIKPKLDYAQVVELKRLYYEEGLTHKEIGQKLGIEASQAGRIAKDEVPYYVTLGQNAKEG